MKKVYAYTRVSTARQGTYGSSLVEQKDAINRYAAQQNLQIVQWFEEQETAAKRGRPIFSKMFSLLSRGCASGVVIHKIDRSARNLKDWADLGELVDRGIQIHLAHESLDMASRGGRLAADIQAVVAADYVRNLRQEVRKGIEGRLKQGLLPAPAPPGYLSQGGGKPKIPDPKTAPIIRRLFELYASRRYSFNDLLVEARIMGLTGRKGAPLAKNGLSHILRSEFYIGVIHHKRSGERYAGVHIPIIPVALFREVQKALAERRQHKTKTHGFSYRRMIRCAGCGYNISGERQKGYVYYRCHTKACPSNCLREEAIDRALCKQLASITLPLGVVERLHEEFVHMMEMKFGNREEVRQSKALQVAQVEKRLATLTDRYLDGDFERDVYLAKKAELVSRRAELNEMFQNMDVIGHPIAEKIKVYGERQKRLNKGKDHFERNEIVSLAVCTTANISIDGKKLRIDWKSEYAEGRQWHAVPSGGAYRATRRTFDVKQLAQRIFEAWMNDAA